MFCLPVLPPRGVDAEVLTPPSQNGKRSRQERLYSRRKRGRQEGRREGRIGRTPCGAHLTREMRTSNVKSLEPNGMNMQACPSLSSSAAKTRPCDQERTAEIGRCEQISMREGEREREGGLPKKERICGVRGRSLSEAELLPFPVESYSTGDKLPNDSA